MKGHVTVRDVLNVPMSIFRLKCNNLSIWSQIVSKKYLGLAYYILSAALLLLLSGIYNIISGEST